MAWKEYMEGLTSNSAHSTCIFTTGATSAEIAEVEKRLSLELPANLKELLQETNGVEWEITLRTGEKFGLALIWSTEQLIEDNLALRDEADAETYSFKDLLFFGSEGNGDYFAFCTRNGKISSEEIYAWSHDDWSLEKSSLSLRDHLDVLRHYTTDHKS